MSIQAVAIHNTLGPPNTGPVTVLGARVGDIVVSVQAINGGGAYSPGDDLSSLFASTVTTDDEVDQITAATSQAACLFVLARGF